MRSTSHALAVRGAAGRGQLFGTGTGSTGDRPDPLFHRLGPVQSRGRDRSADQPRRAHHRLRPQVQRHHDRQGAADDLAGRCRHRAAASAGGRLRLLFLAALVARRYAARLCRARTAAARSFTCAGWRAAKARASPAFPTAPTASPGRPTAAASLIRCSFPTKAPKLGSAPPKPEGAKWADPLEVIDAVTYRADGAGYLKPGYDQIFWVPADGGAPTQLTFGATNAGGADRRGRPTAASILFGANLSQELGARADRQRNLSRRHRRRRAGRADRPQGPRRRARSFRLTAA